MENNQLSVLTNEPIVTIDVEEVKAQLLKEIKDGFEFSPLEYVPGPDATKQSIFLKVANIMGSLDRVPKSGYNKAHDYRYVTESDVVGSVRPLMAREKLVMMPSIKTYKVEDIPTKYSKLYLGTIEIEWILRDAESYEQVKFTMIGKGTDTLEKDIYKAISGNKKYALISLFLIDSGDDPERNDTPTDQRPNDDAQNGPDKSKNNSKGNKSPNNKNSNQAKNEPPKEPEVKQPSLGDLLTRWVVLAGNEKSQKDTRADFDVWYKKKADENRDHLWMIQALTQSIQKKNEKEKEKAQKNDGPDGQDGQAQQ